jgi:hypothetical protein
MPKNAKTLALTASNKSRSTRAPRKLKETPVSETPVKVTVVTPATNVREGVALTDAQARLFDFLREPKAHPFRTRPDVAAFLFGGSWEQHRMRTGEAGARIFAVAKKVGFTIALGRGLDGKTQSYCLQSPAEAEAERKAEAERLAKIEKASKAAREKEAAKAARKSSAPRKSARAK